MTSSQQQRAGWTIVDQAISSLTNFGVSLAIVSSVSQRGFGAFAAAFIAYLLALGTGRALITEILAIRYSTTDAQEYRSVARRAVGASAAFGVVAAAPVAAFAFVVDEPLRSALFAMIVALPGLLAQDAWRFVFFAQHQPKRAAFNDGVWAIAQVCFVGGLLLFGEPTAAQLILGWGASAWVATFFGSFQMRAIPQFRGTIAWIRGALNDGARFLVAEWIASAGASRLTELAAAFILGLDELAAYRAAGVLIGPLFVVFTGTVAFLVPEGRRLFERDPTRVEGLLKRATVLLVLASGAMVLALVAIPDSLGERLLGETWPEGSKLVFWVALTLPTTAVVNMSVVALRIIAAMDRSLRLRLVTAPILLVAVLLGAVLGGAKGMVILSAIAQAFAAVVWWRASQIELRGALTELGAGHTTPPS